MSSNSTLMEPWHRIESEAELKALIWAGWTDFTVRPGGTTEWVQCTKELWTAQKARLSLPGFKTPYTESWQVFRDLVTGLKYRQVCVPGPLSAHDKALVTYYTNLL